MQIFITDIGQPHDRVQAALYTALELLRVCDHKLELAIDALPAFEVSDDPELLAFRKEWDSDATEVQAIDLNQAQAACRVYAAMLQEICTGVPRLPQRVFAELFALEQHSRLNPPHVEAVQILFDLAAVQMREALNLSSEFDGTEVDGGYRIMVTIFIAVQSLSDFFDAQLCGRRRELTNAILAPRCRELTPA